ncbi:MAG: universal stress protein [Xanthobacteraceae bacterium]|nr:universal stress protein [Xanthobacteraceae bacterium]
MTYATVMVHLDLDESNDARLHVAGDLAKQFDARLVGIACCQPQPSVYAEGVLAQTLVRQLEADANEKLNKLEQRFRAACQNRAENVEWRRAYAVPSEYVAREARAADLVLTGADRVGGLSDPLWRLDPSELVMKLGRPMMIVPPEVDRLQLTSVVVGWKDTREARRAVVDALPLLQKAKEVTVVEIIEDDRDRPAGGRRVADVAAWLARHQVDASHMVPNLSGDAVEQLISHASDIGADVIVAGAYGHTRMREWIFGGVTRDLITKSNRCSLLSH